MVTLLLSLAIQNNAFSAGVGIPASPDNPHGPGLMTKYFDMPEGMNVKISGSGEANFVVERELDDMTAGNTDGELEAKYYMGKIGATFYDKYQPFVKVGACKIDAKWKQSATTDVTLESIPPDMPTT